MDETAREYALALDEADPLAGFAAEFVPAPGVFYLDGNSLGRLPRSTAGRLAGVVADEWGGGLVRSWSSWISLARGIGDLIGTSLLGARPGEVVVSDSTSVNLYKLAGRRYHARPGRSVVLSSADEFPTDRYVLQGLCAARGLTLRDVPADIDAGISVRSVVDALDPRVAVVVLSQVAYRSGALLDLAGDHRGRTRRRGAGVVGPVALGRLGAGRAGRGRRRPGRGLHVQVPQRRAGLAGVPLRARGPAVVAAAADPGLVRPADQFAMAPAYEPGPGIDRFLVGTPPVLSLVGVEEGVRVLAAAGIDRLRAKGQATTSYLVTLADAWLAPLGFRLASPRDPALRGSHVSLAHPEAWQVCQALLDRGVVPDYRTPDRLRLGPAPLTTRYTEVYDATAVIRDVVSSGTHLDYPREIARVT